MAILCGIHPQFSRTVDPRAALLLLAAFTSPTTSETHPAKPGDRWVGCRNETRLCCEWIHGDLRAESKWQHRAATNISTIPSSRTKRSNKNALLHFTEVNTCGFCDSHDHGEMLSSLYGCSGSLTSYVKVHKTRLKHTYEMLCGWLMLLNCLQTPKHVCWRKNPWRLPMSGGSWVSEAKTHLSYGPTYVLYIVLPMLILLFHVSSMLSWCLSHLSDFHIQHQPSQAILTIHLYPGIIHYNSIELNHLHTHIYISILIVPFLLAVTTFPPAGPR